MSLSPLFKETDLIHVYTRAQAIDDGVLVDVTSTAKEAGFKAPVALTAAVWADCVSWDQAREGVHQDETGRLWDVLYLAAFEARRRRNAQVVPFGVLRVPHRGTRPALTQLVMHIGPGDEAEPVITIMQPGED
jgi:hypothetical protein